MGSRLKEMGVDIFRLLLLLLFSSGNRLTYQLGRSEEFTYQEMRFSALGYIPRLCGREGLLSVFRPGGGINQRAKTS